MSNETAQQFLERHGVKANNTSSSSEEESDEEAPTLAQQQNRVGTTWRLHEPIGEGNFGRVYAAVRSNNGDTTQTTNTSSTVALKVLKREKEAGANFATELAVLTAVQRDYGSSNQGRWFTRLIDQGPTGFMVVERFRKGLDRIVDEHGGHISVATALRYALDMTSALRALHRLGWTHRDVKCNNFGVGTADDVGQLKLFDFGRAKRFLADDGVTWLQPCTKTDYGGPLFTASLNGHWKREHGPHDDLISTVYLFVQITKGYLPWSHVAHPATVYWLKRTTPDVLLFEGLPVKMAYLKRYLETLKYGLWPDYEKVKEFWRMG